MRVPDVPDPLPDPRVHTWPAGDPIVRCHHISMGATEFNTSDASPSAGDDTTNRAARLYAGRATGA